MNDDLRQRVIKALQRGDDLPSEWARELFPPEKREYELLYHGKEREENVLADAMAVPLQPSSSHGGVVEGEWHNMLIFGDNLQVMKSLLEQKRRGDLLNEDGTPGIRLAYIDPPFATKKEFAGKNEQKAYRDKVVGAEFLEFIRKRLILLRELLADDGVVLVHTDWKKGHYIKILLDEIFGEARFQNEIIWWYYNKMQGNIKYFPRNHEAIYFYSRGPKFHFNKQSVEREGGTSRLLKREWSSKKKMLVNARDEDGNLIYIDSNERRLDDVWRLSMLQPADKTENLGYPTQKPETILAIVIDALSREGDLVMDCFAGSGTTLAVAEKMNRRWIGVDVGKYSIYTIRKRLLNLRKEIGNRGAAVEPRPFTVYNAGLYDFSKLRQLPWEDWRFFALQLFGCKDDPHEINGLQLDGRFRGSSVLVFNHIENAGLRVDATTVQDIHSVVGSRIGSRFFIIAPRNVFDFQEDYLDLDGVRYYALRIPYSVINELHRKDFLAIQQPLDAGSVNATVEAVGFDFIQPPQVEWRCGLDSRDSASPQASLAIKTFESAARVRGSTDASGFDAFSMLMLDFDYKDNVFDFDLVVHADDLRKDNWTVRFPLSAVGHCLMAITIDIYGNESREVIPATAFAHSEPSTSDEG